jgi:hypothetical protein
LFSSEKLPVSVYCHKGHLKKGGRTSGERNTAMVLAERLASVALIGKTPFVRLFVMVHVYQQAWQTKAYFGASFPVLTTEP